MLAVVASDYQGVTDAEVKAFCDHVKAAAPRCIVLVYSDLSLLPALPSCTGYPLWIAWPSSSGAEVGYPVAVVAPVAVERDEPRQERVQRDRRGTRRLDQLVPPAAAEAARRLDVRAAAAAPGHRRPHDRAPVVGTACGRSGGSRRVPGVHLRRRRVQPDHDRRVLPADCQGIPVGRRRPRARKAVHSPVVAAGGAGGSRVRPSPPTHRRHSSALAEP